MAQAEHHAGQALTRPGAASAVVVGLCVHGLALVRALASQGIAITALEADRSLPGWGTHRATVRHVEDINGPGLIDALLENTGVGAGPLPVLFLTNDNMVRTVAEHWDRLEGRYRLSWAAERESIARLLDKAGLEAHCRMHDLPYPRSWLLEDAASIDRLLDEGLPRRFIVKPTRPLSGFKVRLIEGRAELERLVAMHTRALPFLIQEWIPGDDRRTRFAAFYLDGGEVKAAYCGRKLASKPPALGQTTVAESFEDDVVLALAERFFAPLKLSGPVSLEVKLDPQGAPWIIEPTVGRTDYWLDCCVANGVNLPLVEYRHQTGHACHAQPQFARYVWMDTERSPLAWLRMRARPGYPATSPWRARFAYWDASDTAPTWRGLQRVASRTARRIVNRLRKVIEGTR